MVIIIQCADQTGLVSAITGVLAAKKLNIVSLREHVDPTENRFYMRLEVTELFDSELLESEFNQVLPDGASVTINPLPNKKIAVMVTKEYHCLTDILVRNYFNSLGATVSVVIGNHPDLTDICVRFDIPFFLVSHENKDKQTFELEITEIIGRYHPDYIVLAKFMRILSPDFIARFPRKIINIHHSFLPAFIGANPYRQAFDRGVKLIGATAHFVTNDLDEGPIITQQTIPVNHSHLTAHMVKAGKEIETSVLGKALSLLFDDRVFVYRNKTVVFDW
ncbi:formyltetrahydrofolate deformylase [Pedobacter sp. AW31-3R]|uniref:formyltetrahydrofolate deformylase n=1 Tax=Pedobacter sp. AW31-3R TaxID=3445781 RepID=UPI003F9F8FEB